MVEPYVFLVTNQENNGINNMQEQDIKSLIPMDCPHCHKPIAVEMITGAPKITGMYTPEMLEKAKTDALEGVRSLGLSEDIVKPTLDWINNQDTIFGPGDVEDIIKSVKEQGNKVL